MKSLDITRLMNQKTWVYPTDTGLLEVLVNTKFYDRGVLGKADFHLDVSK